jgi:7-cyano-7-deazaguanine synthase
MIAGAPMQKRAVILLSGGIDSATTAAIARSHGFGLHALIFSYGQKHAVEMERAMDLARFFQAASCSVIEIPASIFRSALTSASMNVPRNRPEGNDEIPDTYVPARNILFLSYALAFGESIDARHIFIGATAVDYSGYPDCRPEFFQAFQHMANLGTRAGITGSGFVIETPLIGMTKGEIIKTGISLGIDYSMTHSCYDPGPEGLACGNCDSCRIRKKGFREAGVPDPTRYVRG